MSAMVPDAEVEATGQFSPSRRVRVLHPIRSDKRILSFCRTKLTGPGTGDKYLQWTAMVPNEEVLRWCHLWAFRDRS